MGVFIRDQPQPQPQPPETQIRPYNTVRSLTAAAARVKVQDKYEMELLKKRKSAAAWQDESWTYFDLVGEIKYAFLLTGAIASRLKLYVGFVENISDEEFVMIHAPNATTGGTLTQYGPPRTWGVQFRYSH